MAFAGNDDFESYTSGNDLNGGSGGSGWSANWTASSTHVKVQNSTVYEGSNAADIDCPSGENTAVRTFTATGDVSIYVAAQKGTQAGSNASIALLNGSNWFCYISFLGTGNIIHYYSPSWTSETLVTGYSASQWYVFNIEVDSTSQSNKFRTRVHDGTSWGSFTAWRAAQTAATTTVDRVRMGNSRVSADTTFLFDKISDSDPTAGGGSPTVLPQFTGFSGL